MILFMRILQLKVHFICIHFRPSAVKFKSFRVNGMDESRYISFFVKFVR